MAAPTARPTGASAAAAPKRKAGVPVWRVGKPDAFLASAVDAARSALLETVRPDEVGPHVAAQSEGERVVTHLFESRLAGYRGWLWFVTVARISRSKTVTVSEVGLVPSEDAVLAPEWVPWAERVRPEDREAEVQAGEAQQPVDEPAAEGAEPRDELESVDEPESSAEPDAADAPDPSEEQDAADASDSSEEQDAE